MLQHFLDKRDVSSAVDLDWLIEESQDFSAADIETVCEEAARYAADRALEQETVIEEVEIRKEDLGKTVDRV